ncbi:hypothetical protein TSUD_225190 [Trifolium subterraneum]|uniref:RNase H type-1 domain-containing protein n=1 Tax=Trifolium subterraneum TaxID=3900 RepID=A0A2Z6N9Z5_TRISU|nr:hypothetical protein TSUD_225190 [Trifolium subterraneum]
MLKDSSSPPQIWNIDDGLWKPVRLSRNGPPLSHLFFADDVLLFAKATKSQALNIASTLKSFADYSGLQVNVSKSKVFFSSNIRRGKISSIVTSTGINRTLSLEKYLGFPMMHGRLQRRDFEFLEKRLVRVSLAGNIICSTKLLDGTRLLSLKKLGGLGIRKAREANTSLLGKLVWNVHQNSDALWVQVIKQKYLKEEPLLNINKKPGSVTWNAIMKALSALKDGFHYRLGNGNSSFWFTDWSVNDMLANQVLFIDIHDLEMRVRDVHIAGNLNGIYTARDGYYWLNRHSFSVNTLNVISWSWLWHLPAPEKLNFSSGLRFTTRFRLEMLTNREIATSPKAYGNRLANLNFFQGDDPYVWIRNGLRCFSMFLFMATIWWIWRTRNALCLNSDPIPFYSLKLRIMDYALLIENCHSNHHDTSTSKLVKWNVLGGTSMILNVDGSSLGNPGISGFGGLIRNADGAWVHGFFGNLGVNNILHAKLMAIYKGLLLAWELNIKDLWCYSDSEMAIKLISEPVDQWHHYTAIFNNIKDILRRD